MRTHALGACLCEHGLRVCACVYVPCTLVFAICLPSPSSGRWALEEPLVRKVFQGEVPGWVWQRES